MGYYSFYKVIKDILQTIFGRRFFRILLIILIVMCLCSPVFASNDTATNIYIPVFDENAELPEILDNYNYVLFFHINGNNRPEYKLIFSENPITLSSTSDKSEGITYTFTGSQIYSTSNYVSSGTSAQKLVDSIPTYITSVLGNSTGKNTTNPYIYSKVYNYSTFSKGLTVADGIEFSHTTLDAPLNPYFSNVDDVTKYNFNNLYINMGDLGVDDVVYFHKLEVDRTFETDTGTIYYNQTVFRLYSDSDYYHITNDLVSYYSIPYDILNLDTSKEYIFVLNDNASSINSTNGLYSDTSAYDILYLVPENSTVVDKEEEQTNAITNLQNTITSNEYDENQIQIDSSLSNNVDDKNYTNFITEIINSINNAITCDWNTVETVEIPLGFVDENITWKSDLLSAHIPQPLKIIINTFWMFLFGFYIFKFSLSLVNWLKSGEILDGKGFNSDEVITSNML